MQPADASVVVNNINYQNDIQIFLPFYYYYKEFHNHGFFVNWVFLASLLLNEQKTWSCSSGPQCAKVATSRIRVTQKEHYDLNSNSFE